MLAEQVISGEEQFTTESTEAGRFLDREDSFDEMRRRAVADLEAFLNGALNTPSNVPRSHGWSQGE